ncbi:dienelactone hydrolase [Actibacterium sp. 188UL27-1]|nr:dienelactone hydrolase [Actibacterium sp. 188UL27-1]
MAQHRIDTQRPDAPEQAAYGDLPTGMRTLDLTHPDQIDILAIDPDAPKPDPLPRYDRPLTVEMWYPAAPGAEGTRQMQTYLRDGKTQVTLAGRAIRDAAPAQGGPYPLVIVSHGYPGNRFLMSHLTDNLASKGYVVASIDHTDSTYRTQAAFGSTLVNRPLDQIFVLNELARLAGDPTTPWAGRIDVDRTAIIGYSMGGYGAIIAAGGGVTDASVGFEWGGPHGTLAVHQSGSDSHAARADDRIKTAIAIGPWGMARGVWAADGLAGIKIPMLYIAGSVDDVSGYEDGVRAIWQATSGADRALLTFDNANHNAAAPMPAPPEANRVDDDLGFNLTEHYADPVWDTVRMNNITQHFVTAWLGQHLGRDPTMAPVLTLVPHSNDAVWSVDEEGHPKADHSYWAGFPNRTASGLRFETLVKGE